MTLPEDLLTQLAAQHGVVSTDQALLAGLTDSARKTALKHHDLERVTPRVLRRTGTPTSDEQAAMIAVLDAGPGAVLSHHSALAHWGAPGFRLEPFHIIHPRGGIRRDNAAPIIHSSRALPPDHIAIVRDVPVTRAARALFDVAPREHPLRVARALDTLGSRRALSADELYAVLEVLKSPGRNTRLMEALINQRGRDWIPPVSNVQRRALELLVLDGQEPMEEEVDLGDGVGWIGRVDGWDRLARVTMEIDSDLHHRSLTDRAADAERDAAFAAAGIEVVRFDERQVWHEGAFVQSTMWNKRQAGRSRHHQPLMVRRAA